MEPSAPSRLRLAASWLLGDPARIGLDRRVLNGLTFLTALTGAASTIQNILLGTSPLMVVATVVCALAGSVGYAVARRTRHWRHLPIPMFVLILVLLAYSWMTQAGTLGTIGYYFFLLVCYVIVLLKGARKIVALAVTAATVVGLLIVENAYPSLLLSHATPAQRFADVAFALPLCLAMTATVFHIVYSEYQRERQAKDQMLSLVTTEKERVERGMREKQRLLSIVSHDIANALTVLRGEIQLARMRARDESREAGPSGLDHMDWACGNIGEIIGSVRMLEAIEQGRLAFAPKPVDLEGVFKTGELLFGERLAARRIHVVYPELGEDTRYVMADPKILANQVFSNLLSNAIKFSRSNSTITIAVFREGDTTTIEIADQGIGMPVDLVAKLFDLNARTTRPGTDGEPGTGFGMRTVKSFVDLFGGQLHIASRPEGEDPNHHGTTVRVGLRSGKP